MEAHIAELRVTANRNLQTSQLEQDVGEVRSGGTDLCCRFYHCGRANAIAVEAQVAVPT